jgi:hypothetical protein
MASVPNASEVYDTSIFNVDPEDGGGIYVRNISKTVHTHTT